MANEQRGPFDGILKSAAEPGEPRERDRAPIYIGGTIIGLALLLLVLVLPPISILSGGGGGGPAIPGGPAVADRYTSKVRSGMPKLPAGLVAASPLFDLAAPADQHGASRITVPLKQKQSDQKNLAIYSYVDGKWQRLSDASLVAGGAAARGDVSALPGNVAVLRRSKSTLQVAGSLPAGTTLAKPAETVLTTLHPVVFIPADTGAIVGNPPAVPVAGYKIVPAIVALNPDVVEQILRSSETTSAHAAAIATAVKEGNFAGINVDYHSVNASLKDRYTAFVTELAKALHDDGRTLTLTLPMPVEEGGSVQTGAYDWEQLGKQADTIELLGELDQELFFPRTEAALKYITEKVDRSKILLNVNSLSVERGTDGLRTLSLDDALARASIVTVKSSGAIAPGAQVQLVAQNLAQSDAASGLRWDNQSRSVAFSYPGRGGKRTVWIANQFSTAYRLELAERYNLGGIAVSDASTESGGADIWTSVQQLSDTGNLSLLRPNDTLLTPSWSVSDGAISPQTGDTATWTAPATAGTYQVVLIVSDGIERAGRQVTLDVVKNP